jgi:hypothetical protein
MAAVIPHRSTRPFYNMAAGIAKGSTRPLQNTNISNPRGSTSQLSTKTRQLRFHSASDLWHLQRMIANG